MPGVASLDANEYYAHPRNAFWPIMCQLFDVVAEDYPAKAQLIKQQQIALWDVLMQCRREGSLDAAIEPDSIKCNNFVSFLADYPSIDRVIFNGKTAHRLFVKQVLPDIDKHKLQLCIAPSTSPAMASLTLTQKKEKWGALLGVEAANVEL